MSDLDATVIVPCRNEQANVGKLLRRLARVLAGRRCEVLFIDDSDDDTTVRVIRAVAAKVRSKDLRVITVHRQGAQRWGGLAGAVTDGLRQAGGDVVVVMDADLQHPPESVPVLLDRVGEDVDGVDLVMASRYAPGGEAAGLAGPLRRLVSTASTWLARGVFPVRLRGVTDPMTGFFALRRSVVDVDRLRADGFKILLEILATHPALRRAEVPFVFGTRQGGDSKGDLGQGLTYLGQLVRLRFTVAHRSRPVTRTREAARSLAVGTFAVTRSLAVGTFAVTRSLAVGTFAVTRSLAVGTFAVTRSLAVGTFAVTRSLAGRTFAVTRSLAGRTVATTRSVAADTVASTRSLVGRAGQWVPRVLESSRTLAARAGRLPSQAAAAGIRTGRSVRDLAMDRRFRNFALGGLGVAVAGAVLLELLVAGGMAPRAAFAVQLGVTLAANFGYNSLVTWHDRPRADLRRRVFWFVATRTSTLFLSWLGFGLLTGPVGLHHQVANVACLAGAAVVNYYTSDRVVFATGQEGQVQARWLARLLLAVSTVAAMVTALIAANLSGAGWLAAGLLLVAAFNTGIGVLEVQWRLYGWRDPDVVERMRWPEPSSPAEATERFSLIVPALQEAQVIGATLQRLLRSDYPHTEIIVSLCEGDHETLREVERVMHEHDTDGRIRTVVRSYVKSNKPRQLNAALEECTGTVVGVIDAEDDVAPGLLARVDALFRQTGADVVQGGVQLMTLGHRPRDWFKVHNVLEYFFWFTSRVFYQVRHGFVPLGGNTVFIRRDLMLRAGGWPDNLTEDCALGVLLCTRYEAKVVAAYEPEIATREEVPATIGDRAKGSLFWQRVRWNQGFLSVLLEGDWLRLPTVRQRILAGYILATPFLQAFSALLLPLAVLTILSLKVPVAVAMLMYAPFVPIFITLTMQLIGLAEFAKAYGQRATLRHYAFLLLGAPVYSWVLMAAAFWAVVQHVQGNTTWHKTVHGGHHRQAPAILTARLEAA